MSFAPARIGRLRDQGRAVAVGQPAHLVLYDPAAPSRFLLEAFDPWELPGVRPESTAA